MPQVRGCNFPDDLLYDVDSNTWYREEPDGTIRVGMTALAVAMAGQLVAFTPKKAGRAVKEGKSCATVESGKWVGPAKTAVGGEVVAVNEDLIKSPAAANADPYSDGWMVLIKADDWPAARARLTPGGEVGPKFEAKMGAENFAGCAA